MTQSFSSTTFSHLSRRGSWALIFVVAAVATACGGSNTTQNATSTTPSRATSSSVAASTPSGSSTAPSAASAQITISDFKFGDPVTVPPGAQIAITNKDSAEHSVTSDTDGQFNIDVEGNKTATLTAPTQPGTYPYHCTYHPMMHGQLIVK